MIFNKSKRFIYWLITIVFIISCLPTIHIFAENSMEVYPYTMFASSTNEGAITIKSNNFSVNGNIATNGTITYDNNTNISINGTTTENANTEMIHILKKIRYHYFSGTNVDVYSTDYSYDDINININNPLDVHGELELTGNINLNSGIKAIQDVNINGEVKNTNNSIICSESGNISIDCQNVNLNGLIYAPYGDVIINAHNLNLNNIIIIANTITIEAPSINSNYNSTIAEFVGTTSEVDLEIFAFGEYLKDTNSININWSSTVPQGKFDIQSSTDNINFETIDNVENQLNYNYTISEDFQKKYFRILETTYYGETEVSVPFVAIKIDNGYEIKLLDTDEDNVPDIYEEMYGTNISKKDTDNDNLSDYDELYIIGTDPSYPDTDDDEINDDIDDEDEDDIPNIDEITYGTNPLNKDTDDDKLSDYEEIYTHYTNPLNPDTDDDTITDNDEIKLGLDPSNPQTFGIPDSQYRICQSIKEDSDILKDINTEDNAYKLSIDITTSGCVETNLIAQQSSYSNVMQNDALLGVVSELIYDNDKTIENVTLKFKIQDEYINNTLNEFDTEELSGIERLHVFKYIESINMLLPIETQFDIENNTVFAQTDELGSYCLIDLELWFDSLPMPEELEYQALPALMSLDSSECETEQDENTRMSFDEEIDITNESILLTSDELYIENAPCCFSMNTTSVETPVDVVFILQTEGTSPNIWSSQKNMIQQVSDNLYTNLSDVRVCIIEFKESSANIVESSTSSIWQENSDCISEALSSLTYRYTQEYCDRGLAFSQLLNFVELRDNSSKFVFQLSNGATTAHRHIDQLILCSQLNINYSEIRPAGWYYESSSYAELIDEAIKKANGLNIYFNSDTHNIVYEHISEHIAPPQTMFTALLSTGLKEICLDESLSPTNNADTDDDTLTDWNEVKTEYLTWYADGTVILPTFQDMVDKVSDDLFYVENGYLQVLNKFKSINYEEYIIDPESGVTIPNPDEYINPLQYTQILPINSDPTNEDGDKDSILDINDGKPLVNDRLPELFVSYINDGLISFDSILATSDNIFVCTTELSNIELDYEIDGLYTCNSNGTLNEAILDSDDTMKYSLLSGALDNYYLMAITENNETSYNLIYSVDGDLINLLHKDTSILSYFKKGLQPYKYIYYYSQENGIIDTANNVGNGFIYATVDRIAQSIDIVRNIYINYAFSDDETSLNRPQLDAYQQMLQEFEIQHFNNDNIAYNSAKSIAYSGYMVQDALTVFTGQIISYSGVTAGFIDATVTIGTGGTSALVTVPAFVIATGTVAVGEGVSTAGVLMFSESKSSREIAINKIKDTIKNQLNLKRLSESPCLSEQERINQYEKTRNCTKETQKYNKSLSESDKLRMELYKAGVLCPPYKDGNAAHHIVAKAEPNAQEARNVLEALDIDINSACNGVFLPYYKDNYVYNESLHRGGHSKEYFLEVNNRFTQTLKAFDSNLNCNNIKKIQKTYTKEQKTELKNNILNCLIEIRYDLLTGNLKINNAV